jgi:hypothetical protein
MARFGPIVVFNVSTVRSDAFLITYRGCRSLELPKLSESEVVRQAAFFLLSTVFTGCRPDASIVARVKEMLKWLWHVATEPVLETLEFTKSPANDEECGGSVVARQPFYPFTQLATTILNRQELYSID